MPTLAVFNTCIWVAGEVWRGAPYRCLQAAREGRVQLAYCDEMIGELARVLYREPLSYTADDVRAVVHSY